MRLIMIFIIILLTGCFRYNVSYVPCDQAEKNFGQGDTNVIITKLNVYDKDRGCEVKIKNNIK